MDYSLILCNFNGKYDRSGRAFHLIFQFYHICSFQIHLIFSLLSCKPPCCLYWVIAVPSYWDPMASSFTHQGQSKPSEITNIIFFLKTLMWFSITLSFLNMIHKA